jgi:hypothetical protein
MCSLKAVLDDWIQAMWTNSFEDKIVDIYSMDQIPLSVSCFEQWISLPWHVLMLAKIEIIKL